jgi:predicted ATPase
VAPLWVARGQCLAQHGAGEAYLPVLEGLGQLCRGPEGASLWALLAQHAPTWLLQMPALLSTADLEALQRRTLGTTKACMLRELAEALEALTAERLLVWVLEDLHWGDAATVDLLAYVARRRQPARLVVIGTYRPADVRARRHPLRAIVHDLTLHGQGQELTLPLLTEAEIVRYLAARFAGRESPLNLVRLLHQRTDGNPLFLVTMVDYLERQGWIMAMADRVVVQPGLEARATGVPTTLRQLIEQQLEQLSAAEQRLLEAASVAGVEWSAAAVAAAVDEAQVWVEDLGTGLERREQFVQSRGVEEWPDGTLAERWAFRHALYQQVLYDRLPVGRRVPLHRQLGERVAAGYGARAVEKAAELAVHFDRGRDAARAVPYLQQAATNALGRYAYAEAIAHCTRGLELLQTLPAPAQTWAQQELSLLLTLQGPLTATEGFATPDVERLHARLQALAPQGSDLRLRCLAIGSLATFYRLRGALQTALPLARQYVHLAQGMSDVQTLVDAQNALGETLWFHGAWAAARTALEQGLALYALPQHQGAAPQAGQEAPGVWSRASLAIILWHLGYPDQALQRSHEALMLATEVHHPLSLVLAQYLAISLHQARGEWQHAHEHINALMALATTQGFARYLAGGLARRGWTLVMQGQTAEGTRQMRQGLVTLQAAGEGLGRTSWLVKLAEAYGKGGQVTEGLAVLAEARGLVEETGERCAEAELYRLQGALVLQQTVANVSHAESCFHHALAIARRQQAKSLELRAAMSLSRLWQHQGKGAEAYAMLGPIYAWFTEGFDTADLQEAKALLEALSG